MKFTDHIHHLYFSPLKGIILILFYSIFILPPEVTSSCAVLQSMSKESKNIGFIYIYNKMGFSFVALWIVIILIGMILDIHQDILRYVLQ